MIASVIKIGENVAIGQRLSLPSFWNAFTFSHPERLPYLRRSCISLHTSLVCPDWRYSASEHQQGWRMADLANERGKPATNAS